MPQVCPCDLTRGPEPLLCVIGLVSRCPGPGPTWLDMKAALSTSRLGPWLQGGRRPREALQGAPFFSPWPPPPPRPRFLSSLKCCWADSVPRLALALSHGRGGLHPFPRPPSPVPGSPSGHPSSRNTPAAFSLRPPGSPSARLGEPLRIPGCGRSEGAGLRGPLLAPR